MMQDIKDLAKQYDKAKKACPPEIKLEYNRLVEQKQYEKERLRHIGSGGNMGRMKK